MKKIIALMLVGLLLLSGCSVNKVDQEAKLKDLKVALEVFDDLQVVDMSMQILNIPLAGAATESGINLKVQDIFDLEIAKFSFTMDMGEDSMTFYQVDNKAYIQAGEDKLVIEEEEVSLMEMLSFDAFVDDSSIKEMLEGLKSMEKEAFDIEEEDDITVFKFRSDYLKEADQFKDLYAEYEETTDDGFLITEIAILLKADQFYGFRIKTAETETPKSESIMKIIFNAYNDDVDFAFPDFSEFISLTDEEQYEKVTYNIYYTNPFSRLYSKSSQ